MNPLLIARNLRDEYLRLLKTHFNPRQQELKAAFNREIETDGFLTREPFVALSQPYAIAPPINELHPLARERFAPICETPYQHQADACKRILAGKATVVATGTGSGKTEAFLMPIIDHCLRVHKDGEDAVKAIFIYPMNALANDQCSRIRKLLVGTDISYGRYTRETKMCGSRHPGRSDAFGRHRRPWYAGGFSGRISRRSW
ncbi:MAG: DEAD/DEAH box helicase [Planctomycetota bacterium]